MIGSTTIRVGVKSPARVAKRFIAWSVNPTWSSRAGTTGCGAYREPTRCGVHPWMTRD
jgi:hypothetical protein